MRTYNGRSVLISLLPDEMGQARPQMIEISDYLYEKNPFFNICGYICGLCELECNYKSKGGAIRRRLLKRFLSDVYTEHLGHKEEISVVKNKENVAVIGAGPGGLMCAYALSKKGSIPNEIFEQAFEKECLDIAYKVRRSIASFYGIEENKILPNDNLKDEFACEYFGPSCIIRDVFPGLLHHIERSNYFLSRSLRK